MSNIGSNAGSGLRGGVHSVHGSHESAAQNQALSDRGVNEFQTGTSAHHNPGSSFDTHPSDVRAPAAGHHPGSSFDKHPSDVKAVGLRGNPSADNWTPSNTTSSTGAYDHPSSTNAGPHASNIGNKADPRIDSDLDRGVTGSGTVPHSTSNSAGYGHPSPIHDGLTGSSTHAPTGAYGNPSSSNAGPHGSNILNKVDPRIDSDSDNRGLTGNQIGAAGGSHKSNILNKADPRVDSDFDNRGAHPTSHTTGGHFGTTGPSKSGQTSGDPTGISRSSNAGLPTREDDRGNLRETRASGGISSTNAGPHDSNVANKADPRIDSDRDNRGLTGTTTGAAAGPHSSEAANKADPRVDSDRDNRAAHHGVGTGITPGNYGSEGLASDKHHNTTSSHATTGTSGHHNVGTGVKTTEHRPDSGHVHDEHNTENTTHVKEGSHPPHKSNLLNKLDPRVKTTSS